MLQLSNVIVLFIYIHIYCCFDYIIVEYLFHLVLRKWRKKANCSLFLMERWKLQSCLDLSVRLQKTNRNNFSWFQILFFLDRDYFNVCKRFPLSYSFFPSKILMQAKIKATSLAERFLNGLLEISTISLFFFRLKRSSI